MITLRDYFLLNVNEKSPYWKYYNTVQNYDGLNYLEVNSHHDQEAILKFRNLCQPSLIENLTPTSNERGEFILVCFYLYSKGYTIKQFPLILTNPTNLRDFGYGDIRNYLFSQGKNEGNVVGWSDRRLLIQELEFIKTSHINSGFSDTIQDKFIEISTRSSNFENMETDEKLKEIANFLESILKVDNKYLEFSMEDFRGLISNDDVRNYRKLLQCFRHATAENMIKRKMLEKNKNFLLYFGMTVIHGLNEAGFIN